MGKFFPQVSVPLKSILTMQLLVMCDRTRNSPSPELINGEEGILAVSLASYEVVESLKKGADVQGIGTQEPECTNVDCGLSPQDSSYDSRSASNVGTCLSYDNRSSVLSIKNAENGINAENGQVDTNGKPDKNSYSTENQHSEIENSLSNVTLSDEKKVNGCFRDSAKFSNCTLTEPHQHLVMPSSALTDDLPVEVGASARFSNVLENISLPLLYIPTTKQLVAKSSDSISEKSESSLLTSGTEDNHLHMVNSVFCADKNRQSHEIQSQCSTPLMHKVHSLQEFSNSMDKFTDTDRITIHSVDSISGGSQHLDSNSHVFGDNSSLSNVSTGTDFSISAASLGEDLSYGESKYPSLNTTDESLFMDINLHSRNSYDRSRNSSSLDSHLADNQIPSSQAAKKKSSVGFRSFFSKRTKEESAPGWKLFGKIPPKSTSSRNAEEITTDFQARHQKTEVKPKALFSAKKHGAEIMSTTALILENRPTNLPTKNPEEAEKHRKQYEEMIEAAKRKEQRDIKMKKRQLQLQRKQEDLLMSAARVWNTDILPYWDSMRNSKKARDLWWLGLPPNVRGRVWQMAIGNDLNITHELYQICHERAEDRIQLVQNESALSTSSSEVSLQEQAITWSKESSVNVIKLDVSRTFPQLCIFQKGGPYYDLLHSLLGAYACYRPDVGYVQGMSFIAAILLLNMDVADAFVCFANLLNRPCQVAFFRMDENMMSAYYRTFEEFFKENLPKLFTHFNSHIVTPNLYLMEWVFLLYSKSLPLDVACRVWDVFCRDGEEFIFRTAIGILKLYEIVLLKMDFIHIAQFLTKLPENISADYLFKEVEGVRMTIDKRGFHAVHAFFKDLQESSTS